METIEQTQVEQSELTNETFEVSAETSVDANGLHSSLEDVADSFDVTGFKCVKCDLAHMHDTTKHRLSDTFDSFDSDDATDTEYNSTCHCGVQEAARRGSDFGISESEATSIAKNAPIPPETSRQMSEELGSM
jgi:hypothetical protein